MWIHPLTHRAIPWESVPLGAIGLPEKWLKILERIRASLRGVILVDGCASLPDGQLGLLVGAFKRILVCHGVCCGGSFLPNVQEHLPPRSGSKNKQDASGG